MGDSFGYLAIEMDDIHAAAVQIKQRSGKIIRDAKQMNAVTGITTQLEDLVVYVIELLGEKLVFQKLSAKISHCKFR